MKQVLTFSLIFCFALFNCKAKSPHRSKEIGLLLGESYYLGDLNKTHFWPFNAGMGAYFRYNFDDRLGLRAAFNHGTISGSDAASTGGFESQRNFSFKSKLYELSVVGELNFLNFSPLGSKNDKFTPYGFLGLAYFHHRPKQEASGLDIDLNTQQTEGVNYKLFQFSIPMGFGLKYRTGKIGYSFEWGIRKTFTDYLDDVSSHYAVSTDGDRSNPFDFLNYQRGQVYSKDWYVFTGFGIFVNLNPVRKANSCPI